MIPQSLKNSKMTNFTIWLNFSKSTLVRVTKQQKLPVRIAERTIAYLPAILMLIPVIAPPLRPLSSYEEYSKFSRIHPRRVAGCHRNHRHFGGTFIAGRASCWRSSSPNAMRQQFKAARPRFVGVRRCHACGSQSYKYAPMHDQYLSMMGE